MIKITKIPKNNKAGFLLGVFLSFLVLSILHTHHYNLVFGLQFENPMDCDDEQDFYFDKDLNCTIHFFGNSISTNIYEIELFKNPKQNSQFYFIYLGNKSENQYNHHFDLRAPPNFLV